VLRRIGRLAFPVVLVLGGMEVLLRLYQPIPFRVRGETIVLPVRQIYTFDNRAATKLDPVTRHTKNSLGFRGPDPPRDFDRRLTILTIGGSTTECLFLSDGRTWTDVMARILAARRSDLWVNNAGLDGQSSYGHLVLLRNFVVAMHPDIALFLVGANDVGLDRPVAYDTALVPQRPRWRHIVDVVIDHSELLGLAQNLGRAARARHQGFGHSQIDPAAAPTLVMDPETMERTANKYRGYLDGYAERLTRIVDMCQTAGIRPVLLTQPALFGDTKDAATGVDLATIQVNGRGNGSLEWRLLEMVNDVTRRVAATKGVLLIDVAREMPKDSRLFYDFLHFTNEGAVRVGTIVASHLQPVLDHIAIEQ
jgi:lysophospholipase L1-like esterase